MFEFHRCDKQKQVFYCMQLLFHFKAPLQIILQEISAVSL